MLVRNPTTMMRLGMACLVAGALSLHYLARLTWVPPAAADGVAGLFYGLAIGSLLLSARARGRGRAPGSDERCG